MLDSVLVVVYDVVVLDVFIISSTKSTKASIKLLPERVMTPSSVVVLLIIGFEVDAVSSIVVSFVNVEFLLGISVVVFKISVVG